MPWRFFCLASARLLHSLCSSAARPLQQCCVAYAVVLQRPCSRTARAVQHSCSSTATMLAVVLYCHTDCFSGHFEGNNDASRRSTDAGWGFAGIFPPVGLPPNGGAAPVALPWHRPKANPGEEAAHLRGRRRHEANKPKSVIGPPDGYRVIFLWLSKPFRPAARQQNETAWDSNDRFGLTKSATDRTEDAVAERVGRRRMVSNGGDDCGGGEAGRTGKPHAPGRNGLERVGGHVEHLPGTRTRAREWGQHEDCRQRTGLRRPRTGRRRGRDVADLSS